MEPTPQSKTLEQLTAEGATPVATYEDLVAQGATPVEESALEPPKPSAFDAAVSGLASHGKDLLWGAKQLPSTLTDPKTWRTVLQTPNISKTLKPLLPFAESFQEWQARQAQEAQDEEKAQRPPDPDEIATQQEYPLAYAAGQLSPALIAVLPFLAKGGLKLLSKLEKPGIAQGRRVLTGGANLLNANKKAISEPIVGEAYEQGAFKPWGSTDVAADVMEGARERVGDQYSKVVEGLEGRGIEGPDPMGVGQGMRAEGATIRQHSVGTGVPELYERTAEEIESKVPPGQRLGLKQAEDIKRSLQEKAKYDRVQGDTLMERGRKDLAFRVKDAVEDAVQRGIANHPDPVARALGAEFEPIKEQLGRIIEASNAANKGANQAMKRQAMPLTSKMVGGAAAIAAPTGPLGKIIAGKGAAETMSMLQRHLPSTKAWAYLGLGRGSRSLLEKLAASPKLQGSPLLPVIKAAMEKGQEAAAVAHLKLYTNPDYQAAARDVIEPDKAETREGQ
jgi:hypothetical protein